MRTLAVLALAALVLAGCSDAPGTSRPPAGGASGTGALLGVVVDETITPVAGVHVRLNTGETMDTGVDGAFAFTGLAPGEYFVRAQKAGYTSIQSSAQVVAGLTDPEPVRIQITSIPGKAPYITPFTLDGFYECAFGGNAAGILYITDSCDFGYRTVWDAVNGTGHQPPVQRTLQKMENTQYLEVPADVETVIVEAFWDDPNVHTMLIALGSTPIDNACDCSDIDWIEVAGPSPLLGRADRPEGGNGTFPQGLAASRGFLDWNGDWSVAQNFRFTLVTTLFHNYQPPEAWTTETKDQHPVG